MSVINEKYVEEIRRVVEKEFPDDPALQQVHIARKILAKEAELEGLSFFEYIKLLRKQVKVTAQSTSSKQTNKVFSKTNS